MESKMQHNILYSCTAAPKRGDQLFVQEHCLSYIVSGEIDIHTGDGVITYGKGTLGLVRRNQLVKSIKRPIVHEPFASLNIFLVQDFLKKYSIEHNVIVTGIYLGEPNL